MWYSSLIRQKVVLYVFTLLKLIFFTYQIFISKKITLGENEFDFLNKC